MYFLAIKIWWEPIWREQDLSRLALQVYVPRAEYPIVCSYVCRDHRPVQRILYVHLVVLSALKIVVSC